MRKKSIGLSTERDYIYLHFMGNQMWILDVCSTRCRHSNLYCSGYCCFLIVAHALALNIKFSSTCMYTYIASNYHAFVIFCTHFPSDDCDLLHRQPKGIREVYGKFHSTVKTHTHTSLLFL